MPLLHTDDIIHKFLETRGLSASDYDYLARPSIHHTHAPERMSGVVEFNQGLHDLSKDTPIGIIPDYDADGVLSGTVARVGLSLIGFSDITMLHPSATTGYGMSEASINQLLALNPYIKVIVTTDNGSNAARGIDYAKSLGIKVFVTDHHLAESPVNADFHVNPNRTYIKEDYPFTHISGTAVIYKTLRAYLSQYHPQALNLYDTLILMVGISSITDVMPMLDENRFYVSEGVNMLKAFVKNMSKHRMRSYDDSPLGQYFRGLEALLLELESDGKLKYGINADTFGFTIGPILNSPRRMTGASSLAFELFSIKQSDTWSDIPRQLIDMNNDRKAYVQSINRGLDLYLSKNKITSETSVLPLMMNGGVAGLVAGHYVKRTGRPSIVFSYPLIDDVTDLPLVNPPLDYLDPDLVLSASARAPEWFDMHGALGLIDKMFPGILVKWGGHAQAAGLSVRVRDFNRFRVLFGQCLDAFIKENAEPTDSLGTIDAQGDFLIESEGYYVFKDKPFYTLPDIPVVSSSVNLLEIIKRFDAMGPYGQGFTAPTFSMILPTRDVTKFAMGSEKQHLKLNYGNLALIYWSGVERYDNIKHASYVLVEGSLQINEFRGKENPQMIIDTIVPI